MIILIRGTIKAILVFFLFSIFLSNCNTYEGNRRTRFVDSLFTYVLNTNCNNEYQTPNIQFGFKDSIIEKISIVGFPCDTFDFNFNNFNDLNFLSIDGEFIVYFVPHPQNGLYNLQISHTNLFPDLPDLSNYDDLYGFSYNNNYSSLWGQYDTCFIDKLPKNIEFIDLSHNSFDYVIIDTVYKNISTLDLSWLNLKFLDSSIYKLKKLEFLSLIGNDSLKSIRIFEFPNLKSLKLPRTYNLNKDDLNYIIKNNIVCNIVNDSL